MSFKWLKDEKKLRAGWRPRCEVTQEIVPLFTEDNAGPRLTEEGVFVQELSFYRPGLFCVDGRLDLDTSQAQASLQPSSSLVVACQDRREARAHCPLSSPDCHSRCCEAWQVWDSQQRRCKYSKSKHRGRNYR